MGNLYSSDLDRLQLNWFKENAKQRGTKAKFFKTIHEVKNIYTDIEVTALPNPKEVDIIFETYPQNRKTLQRYGWYNKDAEDNPDIAYVPLDLDVLRRWEYVMLPGRVTLREQGTYWQLYHITKISTRMEHPQYYTVALAPVFTDECPAIDRTENHNIVDFRALAEIVARESEDCCDSNSTT